MKQWRCIVCGYTFEEQNPPETCPQCKVLASEFGEVKEDGNMIRAAKHQVGIAKDASEEVKTGLRVNFEGECSEVGVYPAMSHVAFREGYPGVGEYWRKVALEEADHASRFAKMLDEVVTSSMKKNLETRIAAEFDAAQGKVDLAALTEKQNFDATYDSVHEMACDGARRGRVLQSLLKRYFGEEK